MSSKEIEAVSDSLLTQMDSEKDGGNQSKCEKRQTWSSQLDFIMTAIGGAVGLGNIWRFPFLCYRNGGGAFLLPYLISFLLMSAPIFILEISLGQYMSNGCIGAWNIVPAFKGIGWCTAVLLFFMNAYYIVVIAWALYYLFRSFTAQVPWASCDNPWNTDRCFVTGMKVATFAGKCTNMTDSDTTAPNCSLTSNTSEPRVDAVEEFWENSVLHQSSGIDEAGDMVPGLAVALLLAWLLIYLCLFRGIRWTGKIVYFTATFPYILLTILLVRGATLDGAVDGIIFYIKPNFSRLGDGQVWIDAITQVLYSCGAGQGFLVTLGSYNKYNDNVFRNGLIIICVNYFTSLFGGFCVFSVLGFMAKELGQPIEKVVSSGPGLVFLTYPKAITQLPLSPLWACLFFILILFVGLDSEFVGVEGFTTPVMDLFPRTLYKPRNRMLFLAGYCVLAFLLGLSMVTEGGVYIFRLIDYYAVSGLVLLIIIFCEVITIGWVFGADRYYDAMELMIGRRLSPWLKISWKFVAPVVTLGVFVFQLATFKPLMYDARYQYPAWATALGVLLILASTLCIPGVMVYRMLTATGTVRQRWTDLLTPPLKKHQIHPDWLIRGYRWHQTQYNDYDVNNDEDTSV